MTLTEHGIITGLKPVGGWRYPQPFAGTFHTILPEHAPKGHYSTHGDKLVAAVALFRRTHGIAEGEPERDVAEFIRRASPQNDFYRGKVPDEIGKPRVRPITPLIQEIRGWIEDTILRKPDLVNALDAADRAQVCIRCPQNVKWKIDCAPCNAEVDQRGIILRAEVTFDYDPALLACRLHKLALQAAVFLDRDFLPPRHEKAPESCWIPKT